MHVQITFPQEVKSLKRTIEEIGIPFGETSVDLLVLDSRNIADSAVADTMQSIERLGFDQYVKYVNKRLVNQTSQDYVSLVGLQVKKYHGRNYSQNP